MEKEDLAREKRRLGEGKGKIRRGKREDWERVKRRLGEENGKIRRGKREDKVRWGIG